MEPLKKGFGSKGNSPIGKRVSGLKWCFFGRHGGVWLCAGQVRFPRGGVDKAYALRHANDGGIEKANVVLDEAAKLFPTEWSIHYNLACYNAQLGQLDAAQEHLDKSYELGDAKQIKLMALDDEDLKPLW